MDAQLFEVEFPVIYDNGEFILDHPKFEFKEHSFPYLNDDYALDNDSFFYDRSQNRFEAVNTFYHLTEYWSYLLDKGFDSLAEKVYIDVHALGGADQSQFDPADWSVAFGDGNVDDAEDIEVVLHEYVHSLSATVANTFPNSSQRNAMEEGNCDYLSKSYSRAINDHNSYNVFSWDGHNEFWSGYTLNSSKRYPNDLVNSTNGDRDIWSSTLMCIHDFIGREATDSLVLAHFSYQFANSNMEDMAEVLLYLDSAMFDQRNYSSIKACLVNRGLAEWGVGIDEQEVRSQVLYDQWAFMQGLSPLHIRMDGKFKLQVFNMLGQEVLTKIGQNELSIQPYELNKGSYLLLLSSDLDHISLKVLR